MEAMETTATMEAVENVDIMKMLLYQLFLS
jgi:hypothetical protein